jgi:hypothetical protein
MDINIILYAVCPVLTIVTLALLWVDANYD